MYKSFKRFLVYVFIIVCILIIGLFFVPNGLKQDKLVNIPSKVTGKQLATMLEKEGAIRNSTVFLVLLKVFSKDKSLIPGEFLIQQRSSLLTVLLQVTSSKNIYYRKITLIEGFTTKQYYELINNDHHLSGKITLKADEGTMMPDTYFFPKGETKDSIILRAKSSMDEYMYNLWLNRNKSLPYKSKKDALILASVVEKESAIDDERKLIAGVFLNRLRIGMKIQSDPTVAYGLNKDAEKLTKVDLKSKHRYNTYTYYGLPIGPIANPSRESLNAVFMPDKTDFLYFVASGKGTHQFASNLKDHNINVKKWRAIGAQK